MYEDDKLVRACFDHQIKILDDARDVGLVYGDAYIIGNYRKVIRRSSDKPQRNTLSREIFDSTASHSFTLTTLSQQTLILSLSLYPMKKGDRPSPRKKGGDRDLTGKRSY